MIRWWLRFGLFVSSYFPAFLIVFILFRPRNAGFAWAALIFGLFGWAALLLVLRHLRSLVPKSLDVESVERQDTEAMTYVVSYVIPFLLGIAEGGESAIAFGIFFFVIGILYVNSNMIHINPMLNLMGYRIYRLKTRGGSSVGLVTRQRVLPDRRVDAVDVDGEIFVA